MYKIPHRLLNHLTTLPAFAKFSATSLPNVSLFHYIHLQSILFLSIVILSFIPIFFLWSKNTHLDVQTGQQTLFFLHCHASVAGDFPAFPFFIQIA